MILMLFFKLHLIVVAHQLYFFFRNLENKETIGQISLSLTKHPAITYADNHAIGKLHRYHFRFVFSVLFRKNDENFLHVGSAPNQTHPFIFDCFRQFTSHLHHLLAIFALKIANLLHFKVSTDSQVLFSSA